MYGISRAKPPIQNCLGYLFRERVGITDRNAENLYLCGFPAFVLQNGSSLALVVGEVMEYHVPGGMINVEEYM